MSAARRASPSLRRRSARCARARCGWSARQRCDRFAELARRRKAIGWALCHCASEKVVEIGRHVGQHVGEPRRIRQRDLRDDGHHIVALVCASRARSSKNITPRENTSGPAPRRRAKICSGDMKCGVRSCPHLGQLVRGGEVGDPEVDQRHMHAAASFSSTHVARLHIAMDDAGVVQRSQPGRRLPHDLERQRPIDGALAQAVQRSSPSTTSSPRRVAARVATIETYSTTCGLSIARSTSISRLNRSAACSSSAARPGP